MSVVAWMVAAAALVLCVPVAILLVQAICALLPGARPAPESRRPRLAVLIPAHDEAGGIQRTLRSIAPDLMPGDRMLVVADNCSDDTAQLAASAGAQVAVRHDADRRGKGYALDFGVRHLEADPPEVLVIVDADCEVSPLMVDRISRAAMATGRPVQALDLMKAPKGAGPMVAIAEFAQLVRNKVRPLGFLRLGLPCQLMGTGMAFPWDLVRRLQLASGHLVEDMKMGADCARAGHPPLFCPDVSVTSEFPVSREGIQSQRTRWEHGHLAMILSEVPPLLRDALAGRGRGTLALAADMCVPPLGLLGFAIAVLCAVAAVLQAVGETTPLPIALAAAVGLALAILVSWIGFGRQTVSLGRLAYALLYVAAKLPMYLRFLFRRQVQWVRSRRGEG
jgi:cellulose synthase/poly-beta-1,6-N-acetylglucosamine synthase-like glycosyltransferase